MRSKLVVNPASGPWDVRRQLPAVLDHLEKHGWRTTLHQTEQAGEATRLARQAGEEGLDAVFVVGGDGTVNEVINGLAESPTAMGVLPAGTSNIWAKELGLPTRSPLHRFPLLDAARALIPGDARRIDLGRANGRYFLQWAGLGLDAEITTAMEPRTRRQKRLGAVTYVIAGISSAVHLVGTRTRIWIDEERIYRRVILIVISNSQLYGGIVRLASDARLDDGLLDVNVFAGTGFGSALRAVMGIITGLHVRDPRHSFYRGRTIRVEADSPLPLQADGEPLGTTPLECVVVPRALTILIPPFTRQQLFTGETLAASNPHQP